MPTVNTHYKLIRYGGQAWAAWILKEEERGVQEKISMRQRLFSNFNSSPDEMRGARDENSHSDTEADIKVVMRL